VIALVDLIIFKEAIVGGASDFASLAVVSTSVASLRLYSAASSSIFYSSYAFFLSSSLFFMSSAFAAS